jgi:CTP synthase
MGIQPDVSHGSDVPSSEANSEELDPNAADHVVVFMPEISKTHLGGTMRLGLRPSIFDTNTEWSKIRQLYGGENIIWERHRHRYEVGPKYVELLEKSGMLFIGKDEKAERMQVMELKGRRIDPYDVTYDCISMT